MRLLSLLATLPFILPGAYAQDEASQPDLLEFKTQLEALEKKVSQVEKKLNELRSLKGEVKVPLDQPIWLSKEIMIWAKGAIIEIYSYNYENYKQVLDNIRPYFTKDGYESYMQALQASGNLTIIEQNKMIVTAQLSGDPKMNEPSQQSSVYTWVVQVPLLVTYQDVTGVVKQEIIAHIEVVRVNDEDNPKGVGIHSITAQPVKPQSAPPEEAVKP